MGTLKDDIESSSNWIATALSSSGYNADFSLSSLKAIDQFFEMNSAEGRPTPGGLLSEDTGSRLFALGSYVGEVLRRLSDGQWVADDNDPRGEINITLKSASGLEAWPVQKVMKRLKNGSGDSIYVYGLGFLKHSGIEI